MNLYPIQLITIISLDVLEEKIISGIKSLGVKGYTVSEAHGEGLSMRRDDNWEGRNIRIEILASVELTEKIFELLQKDYFPKYKMIAFSHEVKVLRKEKFI
ncbi:MAG: transcriptional regulator [Leptospiraceae bacterium]|nr:transcriptional regulator [Leptospiraceae bacterium]